jgi:uncharacterized damage-inducible protein DinB
MELIAYFRREFAYNDWANRETLTVMKRQRADDRSLALMAHILSAERLWMERIKQEPQSAPVWPTADVDQCQRQIEEMGQRWHQYLDGMDSEDLERVASYKNSKGEPWTSSIVDILTHVPLHSAYHRGQIASHMRESGLIPAYTDFIHGIRQGFVK